MDIRNQAFPFRFVLPLGQLLFCLALLWPVRTLLLVGAAQSIAAYSGSARDFQRTSDAKAPITIEEQARGAALIASLDKRERALQVLDFPVLLAQVPYVVVSPTKREWAPKGMFIDIWRALSWPFAGMFFWWLLGRSFEALFAAKQSVVRPRITWEETTFAGLVFAVGLLTVAGLLTSTPDDRGDPQFMAWIAGGVLWGILATVIIASRLLQRRIRSEAT